MGSTWLCLLFFAGGSVGYVVTLADSRSFSCPTRLRCVRDENVARSMRRSDVVNQPTSGASLSSGDKGLRYAPAADRGSAVRSRGFGPALFVAPLSGAQLALQLGEVSGGSRGGAAWRGNRQRPARRGTRVACLSLVRRRGSAAGCP